MSTSRMKVQDARCGAVRDDADWELVHTYPPGYAAEFEDDGSLRIFRRGEGESTHVEDAAKPALHTDRLKKLNEQHEAFYRRPRP
jgi:hypothetical protein